MTELYFFWTVPTIKTNLKSKFTSCLKRNKYDSNL